jgi:coenzyme PQQ precursor peptide PqqA
MIVMHCMSRSCSIKGTTTMSWKAPKIVEVALGAEINSYACAEARK